MHFEYENLGSNTFLVYKVSENDVIDVMSLGMLTNNKIPNIAQLSFLQMDSNKLLKYNVSSKVSVNQFFSGSVNKKRLVGVFSGIVNAMISAEDYMIDINSIILDLDYIFADVSTCKTVLICLPLENQNMQSIDLGAFFKNIMFTTQFDQTENCDYVAKIINHLNSSPVFSIYEFKNLLDSLDSTVSVSQSVAPKTAPAKPAVTQPATPVVAQPATSAQPAAPVVAKSVAPVAPKPAVTPPAKPPVSPAKPPMPTPTKAVPQKVENVQPSADEKKISFFYLMQHYNKENAELYKAQKQAKKGSGNAPVSSPISHSAPQKNTKTVPQSNNFGFAVPGQSAPASNTPVSPTASAKPTAFTAPTPNKPAVSPVVAQPVTPAPAVQPAFVPREVPQGNSMNFGETTVLGGGAIGETTVLTAANAPKQLITPHLIRSKNNERIALDKPVFRIGKERSYVDYFIGDNTAISRSHANIITRENEYFVVDTNSTNHTYVNGIMIQSGVETKITHGDKVKFANEDFEFKLY